MATGRTPIDEMIGTDAEDIVRKKIYGEKPVQDVAAQKASDDGGSSKLPSNIKPFTLRGGE